jgi:hypothetical protein
LIVSFAAPNFGLSEDGYTLFIVGDEPSDTVIAFFHTVSGLNRSGRRQRKG